MCWLNPRMLFGGNLLRQTAFVVPRKDRPAAIHLVGGNGSILQHASDSTIGAAFLGSDELMHRALFLGTYPGLTPAMSEYKIQVIRDFVKAETLRVEKLE